MSVVARVALVPAVAGVVTVVVLMMTVTNRVIGYVVDDVINGE